MQGTGGKGANLARPTLKHAADDATLFSVIQEGIENTGMPAAWQMTGREIWLVVAHVRSLGRVAVEKLPGDPAKGKTLFAAQGCGTCHIVSGSGGALGPELDEVGARRSSGRLRQCLLEPGSALPDGFVMVRAVRSDGSVLEGIRVNEDSFSIQLRDLANRFHSLRKQQLQTLEYKSAATPMPSYRNKLSPLEMDHLVAYLAGLRGK
jgi:putative heme-binding domain-containing protein